MGLIHWSTQKREWLIVALQDSIKMTKSYTTFNLDVENTF